ncbi:MAG: aminotransferase class IV [Candidatus Thalassarchaeaceae archaeon]|jgi:branched-subunit amino acid aminotransferase/4-amino-4-deoxychorismate lyase
MPNSAEPHSQVWTAMAWDGKKSVLAPDLHFNRLFRHSQILGIEINDDLPKIILNKLEKQDQFENLDELNYEIPFLVKIIIKKDGEIFIQTRKNKHWQDDPLQAISMKLPDFELPILGTKHGNWQPYDEARKLAIDHDSDIALLFKNNLLIDGDYCLPLMLDNDGVAYHPSNTDGALDSVTLQLLRNDVEELGIPIRSAKINLKMLSRASELIVIGSGMGVCSVGSIDGTPIGKPKGKLYQVARAVWLNKLNNDWQNWNFLREL